MDKTLNQSKQIMCLQQIEDCFSLNPRVFANSVIYSKFRHNCDS